MEKMQNSSNIRLQAVYNKIDQAVEGQNLRLQKSPTSQPSLTPENAQEMQLIKDKHRQTAHS